MNKVNLHIRLLLKIIYKRKLLQFPYIFKISFFIAISNLMLLTSCTTIKKQIIEKVNQPNKIIIQIGVDEKTTINSLFFIKPNVIIDNTTDDVINKDLSTDDIITKDPTNDNITLIRENNDLTTDLTTDKMNMLKNKKEFISDAKKDYYLNIFDKNKLDIEKALFTELKNNKLDIELYRDKIDMSDQNDLLIDIKIRDYEEGEFNLIINTNTKIGYEVNIINYDEKVIAIFNKNYILTTNQDFPLEILRLSKINKQFSTDLTSFLLKIFNKNEDPNVNKNKENIK